MRFFDFKSIQTKGIINIILFMVIPMTLIYSVTLKNFEGILRKNVVQSTEQTLEQFNSNFQKLIHNMVVVSDVIVRDNGIISTLAEGTGAGSYEYSLKHKKLIDAVTISTDLITSFNYQITLLDREGRLYTSWNRVSNDGLEEQIFPSSWYIDVLAQDGRIVWLAPQTNYISGYQQFGGDFISLARLIKGDLMMGGHGVLLISLYSGELKYKLKNLMTMGNNGQVVVNQGGEIVVCNDLVASGDPAELTGCLLPAAGNHAGNYITRFQGKRMQVVFSTLHDTQWKSFYLLPLEEMFREVKSLHNRNLILTVFVILIFAFVSVLISRNITRPVKQLRAEMDKVKNGNFDVNIGIHGRDEVGELAESFLRMVREIKKLMAEIVAKEEEKQAEHLAALQAQIHPHFLFNTLNAIKWTAYMSKADKVGDMIASLGKLFDVITNHDSELITVAQEMEYVDSYIALMGLRYDSEISVVYDIAAGVREYHTLKFILQPIVENSIIHGFEGKRENPLITISVRRQDSRLTFCIADNGRGIPAAVRRRLLNGKKDASPGKSSNIGLKNVNERIELNFGPEYGLRIRSSEQRGTRVYVTIPLIAGEEKHA